MGEAALSLVEQELPVDQKALTYSEVIKALPPIRTADEYVHVGDLWKEGRALLKEIDEGYDDLIKAAHKLHKDAVAKKARYYSPVDTAVRTAKGLMSAWDLEQERLRREEQARLEAIARAEEEARRKAEAERIEAERKAEEERLMAAAQAAEAAGDKQTADALAEAAIEVTEAAKEEVAAVVSEPVTVAPVVLPKATPKLQGGPVYRTVWKARIVNERLIPREYLTVDMVKINGVVRSLKGATNIPGVMPYEERP